MYYKQQKLVFTAKKIKIILENEPFASGGEGSIYKIIAPAQYKNYCAKIYFEQYQTPRKEQKISFEIKYPPTILNHPNFMICWATELLYSEKQRFIGFIMPLAYPKSYQVYHLCLPKISPNLPKNLQTKFSRTPNGVLARLKLCVNIANVVHAIHSTQQYTLVDAKPQNLLFTNEGKIALIDTDSLQIQYHQTLLHAASVATPEYTPPEAHNQLLNSTENIIPHNWDTFSLSIIFYEILMGIHPYTATFKNTYENINTLHEKIKNGLFVHGNKKKYAEVIPKPHTKFKKLPKSIQALFFEAFEHGHTQPNTRPTAEQWGKVLFEEIQKLEKRQISKKTLHITNNKNIKIKNTYTFSEIYILWLKKLIYVILPHFQSKLEAWLKNKKNLLISIIILIIFILGSRCFF